MEIRNVIARRSDLSTFLVHLTRPAGNTTARENLRSILSAAPTAKIEARTMFGAALSRLEALGLVVDNQKCVCFTETPLEHVHLLLEEIENRQFRFAPYGIAFPKKIGRRKGVNPVWYIDMTPTGHEWLMNPVNHLIEQAFAGGAFPASDIARLSPFIEQMFTHRNALGQVVSRKEFWWEREWRHVGTFDLPPRVIVLCPEDEITDFSAFAEANDTCPSVVFVDPTWGLEQIISRLAGFDSDESDIL